MSKSPWPTIVELAKDLGRLADDLKSHETAVDHPRFAKELRSLIYHLERHVPGLEPPLDYRLASSRLARSDESLRQCHPKRAVYQSLRGLSGQPHSSQLFFNLGNALNELGETELAIYALCHVLWINPGHAAARSDLEILSTDLDEDE